MTSPGLNPRRAWVISCGGRYWEPAAGLIATLPMPQLPLDDGAPGAPVSIAMPDWASDIAVDGRLLAFEGCLLRTMAEAPDWSGCDWLAVAWHMLAGTGERAFEARHGPTLSYSFRLPAQLRPMFERAWVNRIFLFLRRWAAREQAQPEDRLFGPMPAASVLLTHDVDAVSLTPEIRLKQAAFHIANSARAAAGTRFRAAGSRLLDAARFALARPDLHTLSLVRDIERAAGLRSVLHFYGGPPGLRRRSPRRILIDPGYDVASRYGRNEIVALREGGWTIGLHQSFEAWSEPAPMEIERRRVEEVAGMPVTHCRQHWLHFSWQATWRAQQAAGLAVDTTLGFNDRPGFRAGHALRIRPWDFSIGAPMQLEAIPMLFMDSHFYDYAQFEPGEVGCAMKRWLDEVRFVGGEASVNWHSHTITRLYGWRRGFEELVGLLA